MNDPIATGNMADSAVMLGEKEKTLLYMSDLIYGIYTLSIDDYKKATASFINSINEQPTPIDSAAYLEVHGCLAEVYGELKDYEQASKYYAPIIMNAQKSNDTLQKIIAYVNAFKYADTKANPHQAKEYLFYAKYLAAQVKNKSLSPFVNYYLSSYYINSNMPDSSMYYARLSLDAMNQKDSRFHQKEKLLLILANYYCKEKMYDKAREIVNEINPNMGSAAMDMSDKLDYYQVLYAINKAQKNHIEALSSLEKLNELKEEADKKTSSKLLLRNEREVHKLEIERNTLIAQNKMTEQKQWSIFIVVLSFTITLMVIAMFLYWRNRKQNETEKLVAAQEYALIQKEKEHLLQQIEERNRIAREMHDDIGTSLTSVFMALELIKIKPSDPTGLDMMKRSTNNLSHQINEIIWNTNIKNDNLHSLLSYIARFAKPFLSDAGIKLEWDDHQVKENVPVDGFSRRSIFLIVKELINNAVKHSHAQVVKIIISFSDQMLHFEIADNGIGLSNSQKKEGDHKGNGLDNITQSVEQLNGRIKWVEANGTIVYISIPIKH